MKSSGNDIKAKADKAEERKLRLKSALKANLARRKAQAKARAARVQDTEVKDE